MSRCSSSEPRFVAPVQTPATVQFALAEPTSCVMLRDAKGALEYAD